jgi:hypothetical protein
VIVGKRALPAMALTNDPVTVTGVANRDGFGEGDCPRFGRLLTCEDAFLAGRMSVMPKAGTVCGIECIDRRLSLAPVTLHDKARRMNGKRWSVDVTPQSA